MTQHAGPSSPTPREESDEDAKTRVLEQIAPHIRPWLSRAQSITHDAHYAEDAVSEALSALIDAMISPRPPRDPDAWMAATLANRARRRIRGEISQRSAIERLAQLTPSPTTMSPENEDEVELREDQRRQIQDLIPRLPPLQREVVQLRIHENLTHSEIAERLNSHEPTVRSQYRKAINNLKSMVGTENDHSAVE